MADRVVLDMGMRTSGFKAGIRDAVVEIKGFERMWKGIGKLFTAGGLGYLVAGFFRSVIDHARDATGELDQNTRATLTLGNAWDFAKNKQAGWGVQTVGWLTQAALAWAAMHGMVDLAAKGFADMTGKTDELKKAQEALAKVVHDRAVAEASGLEKINLLYVDLTKLLNDQRDMKAGTVAWTNKQVEIEQKLAEITKEDVALNKEKAVAIKKGFEEDLKWVKAQDAAAAKHKQYLFEQKDLTAQISDLEAQASALRKEVPGDMTKQVKLDEVLVTLEEKRAQLAAQIAAAAAAAKKELEGQAKAAQMTQQAYEAIMFGITNGGYDSRQIGEANDQTLQEVLRRNRGKLQGLQSNPGSAFEYGNSLTITRLQNENSRIQAELNTRNKLRQDVNFLGVEGARRQSTLDPIIFDRLMQQFVTGLDKTDQSNRLLEEIRNQMKGTGTDLSTLNAHLERGVRTVVQTGG